MGLVLFMLLFILIAVACGPDATETPAPTPSRTRRATRTPFPTLTPRATRTATPPAPIMAVVTDTLRVREQPSTEARILGRLQPNTVVQLLSRTDDSQWFTIEYPPKSGSVGWIFGEVVVPNGDVATLSVGPGTPKPPEGAVYALVTGEGGMLRMRAGPGTNYEIVSRIPDRTRILLLSKLADGSWYQANYPSGSGTVGWVSGEFLTLEGSANAMQIAQAPPTPTAGPTAVPRPTRPPNVATGGSILLVSNRDGAYNIYAAGENGVIRRALSSGGNAFGGRYSPNGERILFYRAVSTSPNIVNHVFVMDFGGGNPVDLSARAGGGFSDSDPDWSPDGSQVVLVRTRRVGAPELWTMNTNGTGARLLLRLSPAMGVTGDYSPAPHWSPDGGRIAFAAVPRSPVPGAALYPSIFVVNASGGDERQLTDNDLINTNPVWSPDGTQIAWSAKDFLSRQNWRGWIMNASGSDQRPFLAPPDGDANNGIQPVAWRDNRLLAAGWTGNWNVFLANADGTDLTQVTHDAADSVPTDWLP
ncbi:MAG: SH3 domain-containing protein [Anaerolineae bacterium]|nr:SH3 domain-containing protein [Anaerolineae bacterium]